MSNNTWEERYEYMFGVILQRDEKVNPGELKQFIREVVEQTEQRVRAESKERERELEYQLKDLMEKYG